MSSKNISSVRLAFGRKLKAFRKSLKLTQVEFAKRLNTSSGHISDIEAGKKMPGGEFMISLKHEFNITIDDIFPRRDKEAKIKTPEEYMKLGDKSLKDQPGNELYEKLVQAKDVIIGKQEVQIASLEQDKKRLNETVDRQRGEIDQLKKENAILEKGKSSA